MAVPFPAFPEFPAFPAAWNVKGKRGACPWVGGTASTQQRHTSQQECHTPIPTPPENSGNVFELDPGWFGNSGALWRRMISFPSFPSQLPSHQCSFFAFWCPGKRHQQLVRAVKCWEREGSSRIFLLEFWELHTVLRAGPSSSRGELSTFIPSRSLLSSLKSHLAAQPATRG